MTLDANAQVAIPALGALTVVLLSRQRRAGYVVGVVSQLFWFVTACLHRQWGVLVSAAVCTLAFAHGRWWRTRPLAPLEGSRAGG